MLSLEEKKSRLESLLARVRANRAPLDNRLGESAGDEPMAADAVDAFETPTVIPKRTDDLPDASEPKPVRLSAWPEPFPDESASTSDEPPAEPKPLSQRFYVEEVAEVESESLPSESPVPASTVQSPPVVSMEADPATAVMKAIPEEVLAAVERGEETDESAEAAAEQGFMSSVDKEREQVPASFESETETETTDLPVETGPEVTASPQPAAPGSFSVEPELRDDAEVVSVSGEAAVDWSLKGVLERAWKLGS